MEEKAPTPDDGGTTHSGECAICGGTFTQEHYGMETDNTCDGCGYEKKEVDTTPKEVVLDFVTNFDVYAEKWDSSYKNRTLTASDFGLSGIDLTCSMDANKQPSGNTIDDRPVTQQKNIEISLKDANFVGKIKFEFKQWTTKTLGTLTLKVTHDGGESEIKGGTNFTQEFDLSKYSGITKVALSSTNKNNVGVTKITLSYVTASGGGSSGGGGESGGETGGDSETETLKTIILDFTKSSLSGVPTSSGSTAFSFMNINFTRNNAYHTSGAGYVMMLNGAGAYLANTSAIGKAIVKIEVTVPSGTAQAVYHVGLFSQSTGKAISISNPQTGAGTISITASKEDGLTYFNITQSASSKKGQISKIVISYYE